MNTKKSLTFFKYEIIKRTQIIKNDSPWTQRKGGEITMAVKKAKTAAKKTVKKAAPKKKAVVKKVAKKKK